MLSDRKNQQERTDEELINDSLAKLRQIENGIDKLPPDVRDQFLNHVVNARKRIADLSKSDVKLNDIRRAQASINSLSTGFKGTIETKKKEIAAIDPSYFKTGTLFARPNQPPKTETPEVVANERPKI